MTTTVHQRSCSGVLIEELVSRLSAAAEESDEALLEAIQDRHPSSYGLDDVVVTLDKLDGSIKKQILFHAPLSAVPALLPIVRNGSDVDSTAAERLMVWIGDEGNARECVMVVQEQLEHRRIAVEEGDEDEASSTVSNRDVREFVTLVDVSARSIPRLVRRRLSPSAMLRPLLSNVSDVYVALVHVAPNSDALSLLEAILEIGTACRDWLASLDVALTLAEEFQDELVSFGLRALSQVLDAVDTSIAERYFEKLQPRYRIPSRPLAEGWEEGQRVMQDVQVSMQVGPDRIPGRPLAGRGREAGQRIFEEVQASLQIGPEMLVQRILDCRAEDTGSMASCLAAITLLLHCFPVQLPREGLSSLFLHSKTVFLQSLHSGYADGIVLAWLWHLTDAAKSEHVSFEEEDVVTVLHLLALVSARSLKPSIRFIAFRFLASLLDCCNPAVQLSVLRDFLAPQCPFPPLRVAAVGLLKEKLMSAQSQAGSLFRTPIVLQVVGQLILCPQPENLFSSALSLADFAESSDPARLLECLNLVYVWQNIAKGNQTDPPSVRNDSKREYLNVFVRIRPLAAHELGQPAEAFSVDLAARQIRSQGRSGKIICPQFDEIFDDTSTQELVSSACTPKGVPNEDRLLAVYGASGSGKTFSSLRST